MLSNEVKNLDWKKRLELFPATALYVKTRSGLCLHIGGCKVEDLVGEFGSPMYIYDRLTMDKSVDEYMMALQQFYPGKSCLTYASKAYLCTAIAQWVMQRDLFLDCSGAGEVYIANHAGVGRNNIILHGVNKSGIDLQAAIDSCGILVVDNLSELDRFVREFDNSHRQAITLWLRWRPGLAVDTHRHTQTGQEDSKFGMTLEEIFQAVKICHKQGLPVNGIHFHQGSHFHDPRPLGEAISLALDMFLELQSRLGWLPEILCPGGGWGVPYHESELPYPRIEEYIRYISEQVQQGCENRLLPLPRLVLEPGRSLVARAGVAIYRVGTIKQTAHRRWLLLDGGLVDNPRPALYQARYTALPVLAPDRPGVGPAWFGGPYCESGDILIEDQNFQEISDGELIAIPVSGAYQLSMGSNYNGALKPAVVMVESGVASLIQRRESMDELIRRDLLL